jgi:tRNA U38,U39,U40 pseudouridine synthase TruA
MPTREQLTKELAATVAGVSHNSTFKDVDGKGTLDQEQAVYQYVPDQNIMVMVNYDNTDVEVWYDPSTTDVEWFKKEFKPRVQAVARRYLYGTTIRSYEGDIEPKKMAHRTETVTEGRNSLKISYHPLGSTQIRLAHTKSVTEEKPGARSRNIQALFVEKDGERFRFPYNHLLGARVMALHVESGGKPWDELGTKIVEISRRRKDIMELLRWSKRLEETDQVNNIRSRGKSEVIMLKRMMERAARTGDLSGITEYQLPANKPGQAPIKPNDMVSEAVADLETSLNRLFG